MKIWCGECEKAFGRIVGEQNRSTITNLFANFKNSYIHWLATFKVGGGKRNCHGKSIHKQQSQRKKLSS